MITKNMLETGQWIVPHVEGHTYLNKPPIYNWILAGGFRIAGGISEAAARIPSVFAAFFAALCLSLFWRKISAVQSIWFILPGFIFMTFPDVVDKSIRAEIDMFFTFFVTASIIIWFYLHEVRKKELAAWVSSLLIISVSVMTKGIQAPAFFYCGVIPYLVYKRHTRKIFSLSHLVGICIALAVFALWFVPFVREVGFSDTIHAWWKEIILRNKPLGEGGFLRHFIEFPFHYIISYLPWMFFLYLWVYRPLKKEPAIMKDTAMYCLSFLLISVPVYWLLPGARLRYILPLSGPLALLITIPLHAVMSGKIQDSAPGKRFIQALGICIILAVVTSPFWAKRFELFKQPVPIILLGLLFLT